MEMEKKIFLVAIAPQETALSVRTSVHYFFSFKSFRKADKAMQMKQSR